MISLISKWHIHLMLFVMMLVWSVPILFGLIFTFDYFNIWDAYMSLMISAWISLCVNLLYIIYLIIKRSKLKRMFILNYRLEFGIFLIVTVLGIIGVVTIFMGFGGPSQWVLHLLLILFFINYLVAVKLGHRFFKVDLF